MLRIVRITENCLVAWAWVEARMAARATMGDILIGDCFC